MHDSVLTSPKLLDNDVQTKNLHVTALIPRGEVIRNFVYSGAFDILSQRAKLSVISVLPTPDLALELREKYSGVFPLEQIRERWPIRFQREILEMAHARWLWSRAAQERWRWRDSEAKTLKQKSFRVAKKALSFPFSNQSGLRALSNFERATSRLLRNTDKYLKLLSELSPSLVFNGSHIHSANAIQAVQAAQWLGIKTATFVFSWDNLTSQGRILLPYDYFLVWSEGLKRQLLSLYKEIDPENVVVTGTPQFDFHFQERFYQSRGDFCQAIGADPARPIVLYSTGMPNHMPGEPEIVKEIADMLSQIGSDHPPQLLVRVYPKDRSDRFEGLRRERPDILIPNVQWEEKWLTPRSEDSAALVNTIRHADVGINIASTISLELCMFDKPVINVGYNPNSVDESELSFGAYYEFDHYAPVVASGAVEVAWDRKQMSELLRSALRDPRRLAEKRRALIDGMFGNTLDGKSAKRVAEALLKIAADDR